MMISLLTVELLSQILIVGQLRFITFFWCYFLWIALLQVLTCVCGVENEPIAVYVSCLASALFYLMLGD